MNHSNRPAQADAGQWVFTGEIRDRGRFNDKCAWCEKQNMRLTFEVRHVNADDACRICPACLDRRPVRVGHEGRVLEGQDRRNFLRGLSVRRMHRTCREVLRNLLARSDDPALQEAAVYFDRNVQLSPGRAATIFLALSNSNLDADSRIFKVQIRSPAHRREFGCLSEREKLAVWPVLSPTIRNRLIAVGLAPARHAAPRHSRARHLTATLQALI